MSARATRMTHRLTLTLLLGMVPVGMGAQTCENGRPRHLTLGIGLFHCQGTCKVYGATASMEGGASSRQIRESDFSWEFWVEPSLWMIDSEGPAAERLEEGDVLVAVNGYPITSLRASEEMSELAPSDTLELLVRRKVIEENRAPSDRMITVTVTPQWACRSPSVSASGTVLPFPALPGIGLAPGRFDRWLRRFRTDSAWRTQIVDEFWDSLAEGPRRPWSRHPRSGTMGIGLSCSDCVLRLTGDDGRYEWTFTEYPRVISVTEGGAADLAGLQVDDVLTQIDGVDLLSEEGGRRLGSLRAGDVVQIRYRRGNGEHTIELTIQGSRR